MKPNLCPTCNRPLPDDEIEMTLPRIKRRIYRAVADAGSVGLTKWQIMDQIYGADPGGGARCTDIIKVHVFYMNKILRQSGVAIRADGSRVYRLVEEAHG